MYLKREEMGEVAWREYQRIRKNIKALRYIKKNSLNVIKCRRNKKLKLIKYKGETCEKCGYKSSFPSAFCFHHPNPENKEIGIASNMQIKMEDLKKEVDKCNLLCVRCHAEIHDKEYEIQLEQRSKDYSKLTEEEIKEKAKNRHKTKKSKLCDGCDEQFYPNKKQQRYCSRECYFKNIDQEVKQKTKIIKKCLNCGNEISQRATRCKSCAARKSKELTRKVKNRPTKDELSKMINNMSWCAIGREYGVSDNAVRKWAKQHNLI